MGVGRWLGRLALALGGLVAGVVLADCGARLIQPHGASDLLFGAPDNAPDGMYVTDHELVFVPKPGFSSTVRSLGYAVPLRFDDHGVRGPGGAPAGAETWLAVGDSFTLSAQVPEAQTFAQQLARRRGVSVENAGVDGYSTWQALGRYRRLDAPLGVDGVLLTFFLGNDFEDNRRFEMERRRARTLPEGAAIPRPQTSWWSAFLHRHSTLYGLWWVRARARAMADPSHPERGRWRGELLLFHRDGQRLRQDLLGETTRALRALRDETEARGDRLLVAAAPPAFVVDTERVAPTFGLVGLDPAAARLHAPGQLLLDALQQLGVPACDLTAPLEAARDAGAPPLYLTWDGHWTPAGHAVVAAALDACLEATPGGPPGSR